MQYLIQYSKETWLTLYLYKYMSVDIPSILYISNTKGMIYTKKVFKIF